MARPNDYPDFAVQDYIDPVSGQPNVELLANITNLITRGWDFEQIPTRQEFNLILRLLGLWIRHLDEVTNDYVTNDKDFLLNSVSYLSTEVSELNDEMLNIYPVTGQLSDVTLKSTSNAGLNEPVTINWKRMAGFICLSWPTVTIDVSTGPTDIYLSKASAFPTELLAYGGSVANRVSQPVILLNQGLETPGRMWLPVSGQTTIGLQGAQSAQTGVFQVFCDNGFSGISGLPAGHVFYRGA